MLKPSIPQLREALRVSDTELPRRKQRDVPSVPETIRPIFGSDLDGLFDPARFKELQASFDGVATLDNVFQELWRDRLS